VTAEYAVGIAEQIANVNAKRYASNLFISEDYSVFVYNLLIPRTYSWLMSGSAPGE
jgi:hypothetical protein